MKICRHESSFNLAIYFVIKYLNEETCLLVLIYYWHIIVNYELDVFNPWLQKREKKDVFIPLLFPFYLG